MAISKQDRLYGKLIVDFANTATVDDALFSLYENIQKAFGFSPDFQEKAKSVFPTIEYYKSQFSTWDVTLMMHLFEEKETLSALERKLWHPKMQFYGYDDTNKIFVFQKTEPEFDEKGRVINHTAIGDCLALSIDEVKKKIKSLSYGWSIPKESLGHVDIPDLVEKLNTLVRLREEKKKRYSNDIIAEYEEQIKSYSELIEAHTIIEGVKRTIRKVLEDICINRPLLEGLFSLVMLEYNRVNINQVCLSKEGTLEKSVQTYERWLLLIDEEQTFSERFSRLRNTISCAMVEFLLNPANLNHLKKCKYCKEYFIAESKNRKRCYSDNCRKEYEKEKKRKQRADEPVKYV